MPPREKIKNKKKDTLLDNVCERYKAMYESSKDAIMTLEPPRWNFTSGNPAAIKMFGVKNEKEFVSLHPEDLSPEIQPNGKKSKIEAKKMIQKAIKEGSAFFDWTYKKYKGGNFSATVLLTKFKLNGRDILEATVRDISSLKKNEIRLKELFNNMKNCVAVYETKNNGRDFFFKNFNRAAEKLDKVKKEDIVGKNVKEVFPGVEKMGLLAVFRRVYKTGKAEEFSVKLYQDNRIFGWRNNFVYKLPIGEIVAIYEDITVKKNLEKKINQQKEEQQIILDSIPAWVFYKDKKNRFIKTNKAFRSVMEKNKNELDGKSLFGIYPKKQAQAFWKDDLEVIKSKKAKRNIIEEMDSPKGTLWARTDKIPFVDSKGKIIGVIGFVVDITQQKISEKKLEEKIEEMKKINDLMVGRELKMIELKEKLNKLEKK